MFLVALSMGQQAISRGEEVFADRGNTENIFQSFPILHSHALRAFFRRAFRIFRTREFDKLRLAVVSLT